MSHRHPLEDLADYQLDEVMAYDTPMTDINMISMYNRFLQERKIYKPRKRLKLLTAILVAVLAVALVSIASAGLIQNLFYNLFGGTVQLEQRDYSEIGESATDQGFQMDVLYAVRDGWNLYLLVNLTDIEQERLSDDLSAIGFVEGISINPGENSASMSGFGVYLLEYDESRRTATLGVHATGNFENEEAVFTLSGFSCGKVLVDYDAPEIDLYSMVNNTQPDFIPFSLDRVDLGGVALSGSGVMFNDIESILALDVINVTIPGFENDSVTNIAYKDGLLHVQISHGYAGHDVFEIIELRHKETGEILPPLYRLRYGINRIDDPELWNTPPNFHTETVYELENLEALKDYILHTEGRYYENEYVGRWQVRFTAPPETTSVDLHVTQPLNANGKNIDIKRVTVTPISVTIVLGETIFDDFDVAVIYENGERIVLTPNGMFGYENGEQEWNFRNAFLFQQISSVEIGGMMFAFPRD